MSASDITPGLDETACETSDAAALVQHPRVTVLMITYNHAEYIAEAIESVINQRCDFPFELIIGEDASRDNTLQIALDYQRRHPSIIRVVHSKNNVGMNANSLRIFNKARGDYIAYCEGDDFWCDSNKLARQVTLIDSNPEIGIVHSDWTRCHKRNGTWQYSIRDSVHARVPNKYLQGNIFSTWYYPKILRTCTILLRKSTMTEWYASNLLHPSFQSSDSVLASWITSRSQVGYIPSVTAVYRVSPHSILRSGNHARVNFYKSALAFDTVARDFFKSRPDYPHGFRWDTAAGLLLWGLKARDFSAVKYALNDFRQHFNLLNFVTTGLRTLAMRMPSWKRQPRDIPQRAALKPPT